jgi:hypothetical protein
MSGDTFDEGGAGGTHIAAILEGYTYVTLVDYNPGSKLEADLKEINRKLDHIFALLVAGK